MIPYSSFMFITYCIYLSTGDALNTCDRNYVKVGCYDEYRPLLKDLVVYERYEIQWNNIENYMHQQVHLHIYRYIYLFFVIILIMSQ